MLKKFLIFLNILFLGVIITPKNLTISANDKPIYISNLSILPDGIYKILETDTNYIIFDRYDSILYSWYCDYDLINKEYLYNHNDTENDYQKYSIRIKNGVQININYQNIVDLEQVSDGLYFFEFDEIEDHQVVTDLSTKVKYQIRTMEFTRFGDLSKYYKLDYEYNNKLYTYYLVIIHNGEIIDISNILFFFNSIATNYKLFFIDEKVNDYYARVHDENRSYNIYSNPSNFYIIREGQYLLYSYEDDKYGSVDKSYIDKLILDLIYKEYKYSIFAPSLSDYLDNAINNQNKVIKEILGYDNANILNGLYLNGLDNKIFKVSFHDYDEKLSVDLKKFARKFQFYPSFQYIDKPALIDQYAYTNGDFRINDDSFKNIFGTTYFNEFTSLLFFINGDQIDISKLSIKEIVWLMESVDDYYFRSKLDYKKFINSTILESDVVEVNKYTDVPFGKGFVKLVKNGKYHNIYFFNSLDKKYYLYKKIDIIDKLQDNPLDYKITFEKDDNNFLLYFTNDNESLTWDIINKKYSKLQYVFVKSDKLFTSSIKKNNILYNYLNFSLNINPDKIESLTVNYNTRLNYYHSLLGIKVNSEPYKNVTKTINSDESLNPEKYINNKNFITAYVSKKFFNKAKTNLSEAITESNVEGYDWQVLLDFDYASLPINLISKLNVSRSYDQLTLLEVSYWQDGVFYESVQVDDQKPSDEYESPVPDTIFEKIYDFFSRTWNDLKDFINQINSKYIPIILSTFILFGSFNRKRRR